MAIEWTSAKGNRVTRWPFLFDPVDSHWRDNVSIQITDSNNPKTRTEVAERIGALVAAFRQGGEPNENGAPAEHAREDAISDAARSLFFGLVGSYPTAEEYAVMMRA